MDLSLAQAVAALRRGGLVACPTEAVWGLSCDPLDRDAVQRLLDVKRRPVEKGLIVAAADFAQLQPLLDLSRLPADRLDAVLAQWPGPHTWVLPASATAPRWVTGAHDGIAVRVTAHPQMAALCRAFGGPLVSTSANFAGAPPAYRRGQLDPALLALTDGALADGDTGGLAQPTPIRDAASGALFRA
ncbi:Sua5/YciO/YrdC/YwlC family protein [Stenotrophomonas sp. MMGLT7]|uniref:Sua5/YciO/YrdC/YwlC family protein n=1 Tax=Stenotrophomonas sp. MMGLT7 TaxID=2901227 RepID=UPI001E581CF8|nr:Sua5/YciO/YrdC/YwlC family protein [Stenotrophomonas sp. MMGLT7]MCD7098394.1 Sua5/YciO/YrdC/YwlC family protein [Stenotrophomonas sp. MMGLT7]